VGLLRASNETLEPLAAYIGKVGAEYARAAEETNVAQETLDDMLRGSHAHGPG